MIRALYEKEKVPMQLLLLADPSKRFIFQYLERGQCFVMEKEGEIIGEYVLLPTRPDTVEIVNIAVAASHQGKGLGKELIKHAMETAREQKYHTIEIGTGNSSMVQLALYQKCGFRMVAIDRDFFLRHYDEPIFENGMQVTDMIRLSMDVG